MTWIETTGPDKATGKLADYYGQLNGQFPSEYSQPVPALARADGSVDSIVAAHSLIPEALHHALSTLVVLQSPELPLSRRQQEMIATVVSALNHCYY
jgi:hypothetical protein